MATDILATDFDSRLRLKTKVVGGERIKRAKDNNEDIAILSMFLPGATAAKENSSFRCGRGMECLLGDCRDTTPGRPRVLSGDWLVLLAMLLYTRITEY